MADYYPLIARAVAGLETNSGENRRALYERARTALITQLRGIEPALGEAEITRERLALEEAIRKVEADAAHRSRTEPPRSEATKAQAPKSPPPDAVPSGSDNQQSLRPRAGDSVRGMAARPASSVSAGERAADMPARTNTGPRPSLSEQGTRGFRDVVADTGDLGAAAAQATRSARKTFAELPSSTSDIERLEPVMGTGDYHAHQPPAEAASPETKAKARDAGPRPQSSSSVRSRTSGGGRSLGDFLAIAGIVGLVLIVAGGVAWQWPRIVSFGSKMMATQQVKEAPREAAPQTQPKITDRVGQPSTEQTAAVAQRVVLYEEDPALPQGKQSVGSAVWRLETVPASPGQPADVAIRADIEIPERQIKISLSIRRNTDASLPASHTAELIFNLPPNFSAGAVGNVPGVLMKTAEQTRGTPLAGLAVKVTDGFFLIGLSNVEADRQRNIAMMKERGWFDIPIVYTNQRRAILALEKGAPGERAFQDAFKAWGQ